MAKYQDMESGSDANDGTTWALAKLTIEGLLAVLAAGEDGFCRRTNAGTPTADTAAANRTLTSSGTLGNPCNIYGVKDGTTAEPPTVSDLIVKGTDSFPQITTTGASDITHGGHVNYFGIHMTTGDQTRFSGTCLIKFINGKYSYASDFISTANNIKFIFENTDLEPTSTAADLRFSSGSRLEIYGGKLIATAVPAAFLRSDTSNYLIQGFDFTELGNSTIHSATQLLNACKLINCKMPATYTYSVGTLTISQGSIEEIGCNDGSSKGATTSYQDYYYADAYGSIENEAIVIRSNGADDGASGAFAYAMTPYIDATLEGSQSTLKSPWMNVWVAGGANTLTVYIANDTASTDFNEDEVWVEFYTPDAGDTAQHDQNFNPALERLLDSTTIITDDTGSTWGTGGGNHQKMSVTVTTGFEGWAYARLHYAKRFASSPATLYLDPKIAVS